MFLLSTLGCLLLPAWTARDRDLDGRDERVDCDDYDPTIHPGAPELCNGLDDDCDGVVDDVTGSAVHPWALTQSEQGRVWFRDVDGDGYGDPTVEAAACNVPEGFASSPDDCDDTDDTIWPGAPEVCGDGIDQACDGIATECCGIPSETLDSYVLIARSDGHTADLHAMAAVGDLDGDGRGELLVGASAADDGAGAAWVFPGGNIGELGPGGALATISGVGATLGLGSAVSGAPDWDGDGRGELAVAAFGAVPGDDAVCVFAYAKGTQDVPDARACWFGGPGARTGESLGLLHDLDGDALVVADPGAEERGDVYLLDGGAPSGWVADAATATLRGKFADGQAGLLAAPVGDLDGDGTEELLVGDAANRLSLARGPFQGDLAVEDLEPVDVDLRGTLSAGGAGDTDGDGLADLWIGASLGEKSPGTGSVYVWSGPVDGARGPNLTLIGEAAGDDASHAAPAGDLDADGRGDLVIGVPGTARALGKLYVVSGGASGVVDLSCGERRFDTEVGAEGLGVELRTAGDLDGDGLPELYARSDIARYDRAVFVVSGKSLE